MTTKMYDNKHYNTPGHAHELTFSCYRRLPFFCDVQACTQFLTELKTVQAEFTLHLWAFVILPNHVHLLFWPQKHDYDIGEIEKNSKMKTAKKYLNYLKDNGDTTTVNTMLFIENDVKQHQYWQRGGGFDRNIWNSEAIHASIHSIEANPVRRKLVTYPMDWA